MKRNTKSCPKCNRYISNSNFNRHVNSCGKQKQPVVLEEWKIGDKYRCPHCDKTYSKYGLGIHIWRSHGEGITFKPLSGKTPWNKGLTKETSESLRRAAETLKSNIKSGKVIPSMKGKHLSEESKKKISIARIKYLKANPDKVPYLLNHSSSMSYPERLFASALENEGMTGWVYGYQNSIYQYDFAWPDIKLDVEIDGSTHQLEHVKLIDEKRDLFSTEQGWTVLRFTDYEIKNDIHNVLFKINYYIRIIELI